MAYEENATRLEAIMKAQNYGLREDAVAKFLQQSEEERIRTLKKVFNADIAGFERIELWEGEVPGFNAEYTDQNRPGIVFFPAPSGECRGVVLVAPGGGYNCKVSSAEGYPVLYKLMKAGFSTALLDYRVKPYTQYCSVLDIQRAVRVLRYRAGELNIKPDKIAVSGSSAGGHLSAMAAVHFDDGDPHAADPVERVSSRPDAAVISYGIFSQVAFPKTGEFVKIDENSQVPGDASGLVSSYSDKKRAEHYYFSPEKHVTPKTPPFFMWQTCDDDDPRQMFNFAKELADCGVRFEAHIFPFGPHGMGLADGTGLHPADAHVMHWSNLAAEWLKLYDF